MLGKLVLSKLQLVWRMRAVMMLLCGALVLFRAFREQRGGSEAGCCCCAFVESRNVMAGAAISAAGQRVAALIIGADRGRDVLRASLLRRVVRRLAPDRRLIAGFVSACWRYAC